MNSLDKILSKYVAATKPEILLGVDETLEAAPTEPTPPKEPAFDRNALKSELSEVRKMNQGRVQICVAVLVTLMVVIIALTLTNINDTSRIGGITISGLGASAILNSLLQITRENQRTDNILTLVSNLDIETAQTIIKLLYQQG